MSSRFWRRSWRVVQLLAALSTAAGCASRVCSPNDPYVLSGMIIADPSTEDYSGPQDLEIADGVIVSIAPTGARQTQGANCRYSYEGAYAVPGLWDMHIHAAKIGPESMPLYIANGVTSVRDMGGDLAQIRNIQAMINRGDLLGPRIFTPGPMLDTRESVERAIAEKSGDDHSKTRIIVDGPQEAKTAVAALQNMGVDFVKIRETKDAQTYEAILAAGREAQMQIAGHPRWDYPPAEAARRGQASFEHGFYPFPLSSLSADARNALFSALRESGAAHVPTLTAWKGFTLPISVLEAALADEIGARDPRNALLTQDLRANWREYLTEWRDSKRNIEGWREALATAAQDMSEFRRAGVTVLVGSDAAVPFAYPGSGVADEMTMLYNLAGLSPRDVLAAATTAPAAFMGAERLGRIAVGMTADIVILDRDPRIDVSAIRNISAVIKAGQLYDRATLDGVIADVKSSVATVSNSPQ